MKYYKYSDPFFALIGANSREEADSLYKSKVIGCEDADDEADNEFEKAVELTLEEAQQRYKRAQDASSDGKEWPGLDNEIYQSAAIILIDSDLC